MLKDMDHMHEVSQKIEKIISIFLDVQLFCARQDNMEVLARHLENTDAEFRSIAYESASLSIALKALGNGRDMDNWLYYAEGPARAHKAQVYLGLGWAIAKLNLPFLSVVEKIETQYYHRVADGCGYYDGSFRQRQAVLAQQLPGYLPEAAKPIYDQGIGRSLWYSSKADIYTIRKKVESFPAGRRADLWRGVGIAVTYVGGCSDQALKAIWDHASYHSMQLAFGAALAAKSRMDADTMTPDTDRCSRLWFTLTAGEANGPAPADTGQVDPDNDTDYFNWISQIEERLAGSFEKVD